MTHWYLTLIISTMLPFLQAWGNFGSKHENVGVGVKSTALDVLAYLNRSNKLSFIHPMDSVDGVIQETDNNNNDDKEDSDVIAVVTGGNSGIGAITCKTLALAGCSKVILCARNPKAAKELIEKWPSYIANRIVIQELDLANLNSVYRAAEQIRQLSPSSNGKFISMLVNNAGVMAPQKRLETQQGIELQFGTNHVGHHMLTRLLLPSMKDTSRIVTVASTAHTMAPVPIQWERPMDKYSPFGDYGQSKLANILFAKRLQELLKQDDQDTTMLSVSLHPGVIRTPLWKTVPGFVQALSIFFADKTIEQGAATSVYCCLADDIQGGAYYSDCNVAKLKQGTLVDDTKLRIDLWDYTECLIEEKGFVLPKMKVHREEEKQDCTNIEMVKSNVAE
jgi:NAD(P)-dependent dehydrogenase (short-subunit alcohol dehydrogenase family)